MSTGTKEKKDDISRNYDDEFNRIVQADRDKEEFDKIAAANQDIGTDQGQTQTQGQDNQSNVNDKFKRIAEAEEFDKIEKKVTGKETDQPDDDDDSESAKQKRRWWHSKRNQAVGGSLLGGALITAALGTLSIGWGPLKFLHIAQLLSDADFGSTQDQDDESILRLYRYIRALNQGVPENTRMNAAGNKMADRVEARLNSVGLSSTYTNIFGHFDGFAIDRSYPEYRGMNDQQLRDHFKNTYGLDLINGSDLSSNPGARGKLVIDAKKIGFFKQNRFIKTKLKQAGVWRVFSAGQARVLGVRLNTASIFHVLKIADEKLMRGAEDKFNAYMRERRNKAIREGTTPINTETRPAGQNDAERQAAANNAEQARNGANEVINEGRQADTALRQGNADPLSTFRNSLTLKVSLTAASATAVPCLMLAVNEATGEIERKQVLMPLARQAVEFISIGSQIKSGHDLTARQLGFYDKMLQGTNSQGKKSTFWDAAAIKAADGKPNEGYPPDQTLRSIGQGGPFVALSQGNLGAVMSTLCSPAIQGGLLLVSFIGGPLTTAFQTVVAYVTLPHIIDAAAQWLSGNPVNIEACCDEKGSQLRFGSRSAAGEQGFASGGRQQTVAEEQELVEINNFSIREDFAEKSLAYRLFNPYDYRTPMARFIDRYTSQSLAQSMTDAFSGLTNMGSLITGNIANLASGRSSAAGSTYYQFPFAKVAFSRAEMNDTRFQNPYTTSAAAGTLFDSSNGQVYINRMLSCNAVAIDKDQQGKWNAHSIQNTTPTIAAASKPECQDQSYEWLLTRFFVKYTMNMNSMTCIDGGDDESCGYIGFSNG
jgi:hypothetical protein